METPEAATLLRPVIPPPGGIWADLGAGSGTFTRALATLLGEGAVIYAGDRLPQAAPTTPPSATIQTLVADFRDPLPLPDLDGIVMGNSLHFIPYAEQSTVLKRIISYLKPDGVLVLVEYDQHRRSRWVPYPVPLDRFESLANEVGLTTVREIGRRRSRFGPTEMYAGVATKREGRNLNDARE